MLPTKESSTFGMIHEIGQLHLYTNGEDSNNICDNLQLKPKINLDNTINIKSAKESWSREQVIQLLIDCCGEVSCEDGTLLGKEPIDLYKWIKENL